MSANGNCVPMTGRRFGALVVVRREGTARLRSGAAGPALWRCVCDCGASIVAIGAQLRSGNKQACGVKGHFAKSPIYAATRLERTTYYGMLQRCYDTSAPGYKNYGAKGIRVCARWRASFENFLADMGPRPSAKHSIDRYPKQDGNYEPKNCRWATAKEQARNREGVVYVDYLGQRISVAEYAERAGVGAGMLHNRLKRGWSVEEALTTPRDGRAAKSLEKWLRTLGQARLLLPVSEPTTNSQCANTELPQ